MNCSATRLAACSGVDVGRARRRSARRAPCRRPPRSPGRGGSPQTHLIITPRSSMYGEPGLDLDRAARLALEVAHLLGLRVRPRPALAVADHVPERHQVRPAVARRRWRRSASAPRRGTPAPPPASSRSAARRAHVARRDQALGGGQHRLARVGGLEHDRVARLLEHLAHEEVDALEGDLDDDPPVRRSSARTVRCSRAQRACSAEISTRATREPPTVPVRGQPPMSAIGFRPSRGSKRSISAAARLIRSSRKWRSCPRSRSQAATYQASLAVEERVGLDHALGVAVLGLRPVLDLEQPGLVHGQLDRVA